MHEKSNLTEKNIAKIIGLSIIVDLIQTSLDLVPVIGWILNIAIDFIAWATLYMLFKRYGVNFNSFKRFMYFNSGLILDFFPFINSFAWTIDVILVIWTVKQEERSNPAISG
jgi:hypothetical protein